MGMEQSVVRRKNSESSGVKYTVTGMSCAACSARVEKAVSSLEGVELCSVNLLTNSMTVEGTVSSRAVMEAVRRAGYGASPSPRSGAQSGDVPVAVISEEGETTILLRRLLVSLGFLLVLMYFSMGHRMLGLPIPAFFRENPLAQGMLQMILAAVVMVINQRFFLRGFLGLLHRAPNMDTLVALGSGASFLYSTVILFAMSEAQLQGDEGQVMACLHDFYFESAAMILTLITVGKLLEARSRGRTTDALKSLMQLTPAEAAVVREKVGEQRIPVEQVLPGDIFLVRPGESIPVDGVILEGTAALDESTLTGESIPVDKKEGDPVSAGTINRSGFLRCRAVRVGQDTTLAEIIRMVSDASAGKAPIARVADRVSGIFVPAVMTVAAVTFLVWMLAGQTVGFSLARAISVLVINCPCALGLATPVAVMVGSGAGARNGILFKTGVSLEEVGKTEILVLDKTGTITRGEPEVTDILPAPGVTQAELLCLAYSLEYRSEHPLGKAVVRFAEDSCIPPEPGDVRDFRVFPGHGLSACLQGVRILGGSAAWISAQLPVPGGLAEQAEKLAEAGRTPLYFAREDRLLGVIAVADVVKPESEQAIRELKDMGLRVVMLTGDNEKTARAIAHTLGVEEVIAGVLPQGKEAEILRLKQEGRVTMVGDGINDAPALTCADMGMAIGAGTDVAMDAADVVLMKSRLTDVPAAVRLSRATLRNIRENLFWAFFYNMIGIPLAAGVWIPICGLKLNPMIGAAAMSLSSFCVVSNALRLNLFRLYEHKNTIRIMEDKKVKDKKVKITMKIEGMMCGHCEARVKKTLEAIPQVECAEVSHTAGTAVVTLKETVDLRVLKAAVEAQDYPVTGME